MKRTLPVFTAAGYLIVFGFIVVISFVSLFNLVKNDVSSETHEMTIVASTDID